MTAPELLRQWRETRQPRISQQDAADSIGVRQATWSAWEGGRAKPQVEQAIAIERLTSGEVPVVSWAAASAADPADASPYAKSPPAAADGASPFAGRPPEAA